MRKDKILKAVALLLPNLAILIGKLAMDKRIPWETKTALGAAAVYIASPFDGIPDFIPVLGQLEDAFIALLIIDGIINNLDQEIVREHWNGETKTLEWLGAAAK